MDVAAFPIPLIFTFHELISGNGYVAAVSITGRALWDIEDGEEWFYGVQPGGIAGGGANYAAACRDFKISYTSVLFDIAAEAPDFASFAAEVGAFFHQINEPNAEQWETALARMKDRAEGPDGLKVVSASKHPPAISVEMVSLTTASPRTNAFDDVDLAKVA